MDKAVATLLLTFIAGSVLICQTSARNTACFNANGVIKRVFCDGREITKRLINRDNPNKCDCIQLDICTNITIRAKGYQRKDKGQSRSGIGVCQTASPTPYRDWVCMKSSLNKAWKGQSMNVRNSQHWRPAQKTTKAKSCHGKKRLPCKQSMFWNEGVDVPSIDCVLQQCADDCLSCVTAGPGKCDRNKCTYGSGVNVRTQETRCNHKCRLEVVTWGQKSSGTGYMRLIDFSSESKDTITANSPGSYLALVDMNRCVFSEKYFSDWAQSSATVDVKLLAWKNDATMMNRIAASLDVGGTASPPSTAPGASVYNLGAGVDSYVFDDRNCSISAVLKGFNYGPTTLESFVVNNYNTASDPNTGC